MMKQLKISFSIDAETFVRMLAVGHQEMAIEVFGDQPPAETPPAPPQPKQITNGRGGMTKVILKALKTRPHTVSELMVVIVRAHYSKKSVSSVVSTMHNNGLIRRAAKGTWALTKKGLANAG
jgi:predicted transcriptional regulator